MELAKRLGATGNNTDYLSVKYQPKSYVDMDGWLNNFPSQAWLGLLGAYAAGGMSNVIHYMNGIYAYNLSKWREKDLKHYFNSRTWSDFKSRSER